jgi:diguanylate cyclase (GGDEF)-like protein
MKKYRLNKKVFIPLIVLVVFIIIGVIVFNVIIHDENRLTVEERGWITENVNKVQSINVINNIDVFGAYGSGVFYDFIDSLEKEYNLEINPITYNNGEDVGSRSFKVVYDINDSDVVFYTEHYVVVSKEKNAITNVDNLKEKRIGILSSDEPIITKQLKDVTGTVIKTYETSASLFQELSAGTDIDFVIVPLEENLTSILTSSYYIDYHISDINKYFVFEMEEDDLFSQILKKYYETWKEKEFNEVFNRNELKTFVKALNISDRDIDEIQAYSYTYGFINNSPYEILTSGSYGGIISEYISRFSSFSDVEFKFTKYKSFTKFTESIAGNKIDLFYNYYNLDTNYKKVDSLAYISFAIVAKEDNPLVITTVSSLANKTVYVLKNSILEKYLTSIGGVDIKTYENTKDLKKIARKDSIILLDKESFNYYKENILSNYNVRYTNTLSDTYNFYVKDDDTLYLLFNKYIMTLDPEEIRVEGLYNHKRTIKSGTLIGQIVRYSAIIAVVALITAIIVYRSTKKIHIAKKIKKEDKIKYIDQLTSLKNRNYLNENISAWNKNTIYPQATMVIDLNEVQTINDTLGYEKGDDQIKSAANILIKTQLDNTDIMRTDGNEFLIYLVGYSEKQIVAYIRKLNKEFKTLPYEHGAAIGYSMILNDMKTIEDSINESIEAMHTQKEEQEED